MNNAKYIAKVYEIIDAGRIEINGEFYYSDKAVLDAMQWMKENLTNILEVDTEKLLRRIITELPKNITHTMKTTTTAEN